MAFTLVLTRKPQSFFKDGAMVGSFGTMVVLSGPKIANVQIVQDPNPQPEAISVPTGLLDLNTSDSNKPVKFEKRYTTMERAGGYLFIQPRKDPYPITLETGNTAVARLRPDGWCYRLHKTERKNEDAILIHEASNLGWLTGCISPRKLGDFAHWTESSHKAFNELYRTIGKEADLFVLDFVL